MSERFPTLSSAILGLVLALGAPLAVCGCGGDDDSTAPPPNRAPIIDGVEAPDEVTATKNGEYLVNIVVSFHDEDGDPVTKVKVAVPKGNFARETPIQGVPERGTTQTVSATLSITVTGAPPDTYEFVVSAFDSKGNESTPASKSIVFK